MNKEQLKLEIEKFKKRRVLFLILAIVLFAGALAFFIIGFMVMYKSSSIQENFQEAYSYLTCSSLCLTAGIASLIIRTAVYGFKIAVRQKIINGEADPFINNSMFNKQDLGTVDVKDIQVEQTKVQTREEQLLDQYAELLKQGLITQEDFNKKKEELSK